MRTWHCQTSPCLLRWESECGACATGAWGHWWPHRWDCQSPSLALWTLSLWLQSVANQWAGGCRASLILEVQVCSQLASGHRAWHCGAEGCIPGAQCSSSSSPAQLLSSPPDPCGLSHLIGSPVLSTCEIERVLVFSPLKVGRINWNVSCENIFAKHLIA